MRVEKHFPDVHGYHKAIDEAAGHFWDAVGTLVVTQRQSSSDLVLVLTRPDGKRDHDVLEMWDQMGLSPEGMARVLHERLARMLAA